MDISKILDDIKGKVLDATNFELLKSAYDLQNNNIDQLKLNNEAITENQGLLKEKISKLEKENDSLKTKNAELEAQLSTFDSKNHISDISEAAKNIFKHCADNDTTDIQSDYLCHSIGMSRIQTESAIDELIEKELITEGVVGMDGPEYYLTESGKRYILNM